MPVGEGASVHSFIRSGPPGSRTEGQPQPTFVGHWEGPWEASLSLPLLCRPTPILHHAPLRLQVPYSPPHPRPCAWVRLHPLPAWPAGRLSFYFQCGAVGRGPHSARHRCRGAPCLHTSPSCAERAHPVPTPNHSARSSSPPPRGRRAHTAPLVLGRGARAVYPGGKLPGCRY